MTNPCLKCKPEMGLKCGACSVRAHAKEINTDRKLCALRECAIASAAALRARNELMAVFGDITAAQRDMIDIFSVKMARLEDPRSVDASDLNRLLAMMAGTK